MPRFYNSDGGSDSFEAQFFTRNVMAQYYEGAVDRINLTSS